MQLFPLFRNYGYESRRQYVCNPWASGPAGGVAPADALCPARPTPHRNGAGAENEAKYALTSPVRSGASGVGAGHARWPVAVLRGQPAAGAGADRLSDARSGARPARSAFPSGRARPALARAPVSGAIPLLWQFRALHHGASLAARSGRGPVCRTFRGHRGTRPDCPGNAAGAAGEWA